VSVRPRLVVCEDGTDYLERFRRFLGEAFDFAPAADLAAARAGCDGAAGILLDLDFRRTRPERLIDERGHPAPAHGEEARRLAAVQGILILRALRADGVRLPALLFADLDDPARAAFLEQTLAPLAIVDSREGLPAIAARLRALAAGAGP
jgi:hypothetical protein